MIINSLKKTAFLLLICVALTGCQRKAGADINEEMDDYAEPGLRGELNIPEKESFEFGEINGKKILLDTENIILPETDHMESIRYKEIQIDRDYKKKVAECIFDKDNEIYEYNGKLSKEMHDENICYYKKCEDISSNLKAPLCKGVRRSRLGDCPERTNATKNPTIPPSFSNENAPFLMLRREAL